MLRASAATGLVLVWVLVISWLVSLAMGSDSSGLLGALCAVAGVTFIASTAWFTRRG